MTFNRDDCHVIQLLNSFIYKGPYGYHFCFVFEILGVNLLEIIKRHNYKGVPIDIVRDIARQSLLGLDFLNRVCGVIHTDLKPENVLVCLSQQEIKDIVENGQLQKDKLIHQRIVELRKLMELNIDENLLNDKTNQFESKVEPQPQQQVANQTAQISKEAQQQDEKKLTKT